MRYSKFCRIYEISSENRFYYILRHSITNEGYFLNEAEFNRLNKSVSADHPFMIKDKLINSHILVPNDYSELKFIEYISQRHKLDIPDISIFYLTFNDECNLACKYCYVEGSYDPKKHSITMNNDIYNDTISFIDNFLSKSIHLHNKSKKITFIYYGSEPLIDKEKITDSIKKVTSICKRNDIDFDIHVITNATLIDSDFIEVFNKFKVELAVSLDGEKIINDSMRKFKRKKESTYDKIIKSISLLNEANIKFGISCTIGPHNVKNLIENLKLFSDLGAEGVGFNILLNAKQKSIPYLSINEGNNALISAFDYAVSIGFYEDRIQRKLKAFNGDSYPHFKDCGAVGNQLVFYPNGDIGVCQAYLGCNKRPIVGNVKTHKKKSLDVLKSEAMTIWAKRHPLNTPDCIYCPALGICGGGCIFNAEILTGDLTKRDKSFCVHTLKILNWLLTNAIKQELKNEDIYFNDISFIHIGSLAS